MRERPSVTPLAHPGIAFPLLATLVLGTACGGSSEEPGTGQITYYQHVKPILDAKCVGCHYEGGIAPFALDRYDLATAYAGTSKLAIMDGVMPPWLADDACNDYHAPRSLSPEHQELFVQWTDTGMLEGDPATEAPALEVETTSLSRVDLTLSMEEAYQPVAENGGYDDYRCFLLPWTEATTKYVTGFRANPGNLQTAHHAIAFLVEPGDVAQYQQMDADEPGTGWTCFGGTGGPANQWLGAWAPGGQGNDLPEGLGIPVEPGSMIALQMHYNLLGAAGQPDISDLTTLEFSLADSVDKPAQVMPFTNPLWAFGSDMPIPANDADVVHEFAFNPTRFLFPGADRLEVYGVGLHMHLLGTQGRVSIERADGSSDCLLQIDAWDFDWQGSYGLRTPDVLEPDDQLRLECHWDNTLENQPIVNGQPMPPQEVNWGEGSTDEMCLGILLVAPQ